MKKARAMYIPAGGKQAVWGPIDQNVLPEGYPYKEQSETVIEFDGNTEGHAMASARYCKVSDIAFDDLAGCKVTYYDASLADMLGTDRIDGELSYAGAEGDLHAYTITLSFEGQSMPIAAVGVVPEGSTMFESGTYFFVGANGSYTESLTAMTETIHPMAPEFLPAGVGGGVQVVTLTQDESGWTSSHTGAQIAEMVEKGLVIGKRTIDGQPAMYFPFSGMNGGIAFFSQTIMQGSAAMTLVIGVPANDTVCTMGTMQ